ncbi:hypothetical protein MMSR116_22860 [Methylobacterium mesophilicum SR1.6/6]|uniref:DUF3035 domain-containing protein n=1 Tax=Methylobacterium mesophilicum SR1.6/6 TaxID=908290 RepID=A0A6B9FPC3_9HYPH|nr:hypothetical protein [Methylobacterium mesophilicum]QGY04430.1 hypothetical protein MMSR116_22860 [Methylobacterium mesophilicum SR1.6/6]
MTGHRRLRPLLSAAVVLASVGAGGARAQERGEFMRDALSGIGLLEKRQDPIDYHERPPLVMPPKLDGKVLPQPRARSTSTAWPKDPEIVERERAAAERRRPSGNQARGRYDDNNATLSVDEIRGGRRAGASLTTEAERKPGDNTRDDSLLSAFDLLKGKSANAEPSDVEPNRDVLTDPPTGYRQSPKKLARPSSSDPINNASREREEADPGAYLRQRAQ